MTKRKKLAVLSCLPVVVALLLVVYASVPNALEEPPVSPSSELIYLPLLFIPPPPPRVLGFEGLERDWQWLRTHFGDVRVGRGRGAAYVDEVRAVRGPASITLYMLDSQGDGVGSVPVIFYWPDAPPLAPEYQACGLSQGIIGWTEPSGKIGFGLGGGSYYWPPGGGPHTLWVGVEGTDCLTGIGMIGLTEHEHLDSYWTLPDYAVVTKHRAGPARKQPSTGYRVITVEDDP